MAHPVARPRRLLALAATVVAALSLAGVAQAQTYTLVASDVQVDVRPDGSVAVDEDITVAFSGSFTYGFREIPLRSGERLDEVGVSEKGSPYQPGASTELEPGGPPGTFGVEDLGGRTRVVWRFESDGFQERTFRVHYRLSGLAVGYDDVVDVNLKVWGDEWEQRLGRLTATMRGPGDVVRAWGHPVWVRGDVTLQGRNALLRALDVDAGQFVELRALYPRDAFTSTGGMQVREGDGLQAIIAEETADAADYERDKERIDDAISSPGRWLLLLLLLGTLPALVIGGFVFWRFGRELDDGLRPRVRAGAADRDGAGARPHAAAAGRRGRLVRVHRDALRPDPPRPLQGRAGGHGAERLGRPPHRAGLRSRALARAPLSSSRPGRPR